MWGGDKGQGAHHRTSRNVRLASALARLRADVSFAVIDAMLIIMAYTTAMFFRFMDEGVVPTDWFTGYFAVLPVIVMVHLAANMVFGTYGHVWEYASVGEALRIVGAAIAAAVTLLAGLFTFRASGAGSLVPGSVLVIGSMLTLGGMGAVRFRSRMFSFRRMDTTERPLKTLVVGIGKGAADLGRYRGSAGSPTRIIGYIDPDGEGRQTPRRLAGLPVLGTVREVADLVQALSVDQVVIAAANADELARQVVDLCMHVDVRFRIAPDLDSVLSGPSGLIDVRDLQLDDLLPRTTVRTDLENVAQMLAGQRVLVTGAGGSIGSEIVRQVLELHPSTVVALDNDETHLHDANLAWGMRAQPPSLVLADIRDSAALAQVFRTYRPEVVFHAAAHKHVPILERFPPEALKTNVAGTLNVIEAAQAVNVKHFVLISTDKAVNPSSIMGATKRLAEMLAQATAFHATDGIYCAVRFGNVLGSRGSVVPTFMEQIARGGPVTVTGRDMERYFMTIDEAVHLVLQAAALSKGGEVFVLDMGEPVKIIDLAHRLIRLAGLVPGRDIDVVTTGVREGEKTREILSLHPLAPSAHPKIRIARPAYPGMVTLMDAIEVLSKLAADGDAPGIRQVLMSMTRQDWTADERIDLSTLGLDLSVMEHERV